MITGRRTAWFRNSTKHVFVALALVALALLLARPVCDAYKLNLASTGAAHLAVGEQSDHDDGEPCCSSIDDGTPLGFASAVCVAKVSPAALTASFLRGTRSSTIHRSIAFVPPDRPPLLRPYYARTARILV